MGSTKKKSAAEIWIAFANLIVTAVVGIGVAIFLDFRQERLGIELSDRNGQLQRDIAELRAEFERQSNITSLSLSPAATVFYPLVGSVSGVNSGRAIARNVKIVIVMDSVGPAWASFVQDVNDFAIARSPPVLDVSVEYDRDAMIHDARNVFGDNVIRVTMDSLPPSASFSLIVAPSSSVPVETYEVTRYVTLYGTDLDRWLHEEYLGPYLYKQFPIAYFKVSSSCENCEGVAEGFSFPVSSLLAWEFRVIDPQQLQQGSELRGILHITYNMPRGSNHVSETRPFFLQLGGLDSWGSPLVEEIDAPSGALEGLAKQAIRTYYSAINNRQYETAWALLSDHFRNEFHCCAEDGRYDFDVYVQWWDSVARVELGEVQVIEQSDDTITASVELSYLLESGDWMVDPSPYIQLVLDTTTGTWLFYDKGANP